MSRKLTETKEIEIQDLEIIINQTKVVGLLHKSKQNGHYWAFQLPYMNIIKIPNDLSEFEEIRIKGYDNLELYISICN